MNTEAMLFIDNDQAQVLELDIILEESVSTDDYCCISCPDSLKFDLTSAAADPAGKPGCANAYRIQPV